MSLGLRAFDDITDNISVSPAASVFVNKFFYSCVVEPVCVSGYTVGVRAMFSVGFFKPKDVGEITMRMGGKITNRRKFPYPKAVSISLINTYGYTVNGLRIYTGPYVGYSLYRYQEASNSTYVSPTRRATIPSQLSFALLDFGVMLGLGAVIISHNAINIGASFDVFPSFVYINSSYIKEQGLKLSKIISPGAASTPSNKREIMFKPNFAFAITIDTFP